MQARTIPAPAESPAPDGLAALARKRIFFGHRSVGASLLEGIRDCLAANPGAGPTITELADPAPLAAPALAHAAIGQNGDAGAKIRDFVRWVREGIGATADVALFKLCYVDVVRQTDVDALFRTYRTTMGELAASYPRVTFAHLTVPLKCLLPGLKTVVRRLLRRPEPFLDDNLARHRFNELLLREYASRAPVFDLAAAETTREDGSACVVVRGGQTVACLCPEYNADGGHLNDRGRRAIGRRFLAFMAGL